MRSTTRRIVLYLPILLMLPFGLGFSIPVRSETSMASGPASSPDTGAPITSHTATEKLSERLSFLSRPTIQTQDTATQAYMLSLPPSGPGSLVTNTQGELLVYVHMKTITEADLDALRRAGARIIHVATAYSTVTAYISVAQLNTVAAVDAVEHIREVLAPVVGRSRWHTKQQFSRIRLAQVGCASAITSEGDVQLKADQARNTFGLDGTGVTVGVLSDSYDVRGLADLPPEQRLHTTAAQDISTGDLPGPGNPCGRTTPIHVLADYAGDPTDVGDEGRAMLQIIHDLAPGADLSFVTALSGQFVFAYLIERLRQTGADVIVDDIIYYEEPFFQDGPISVAIQEVTRQGGIYVTAAGNYHTVDAAGNAIGSYEASAYRPTACPRIVDTIGRSRARRDCHDFNPGTGVDNTFRFTLDPSEYLDIDFQWAEPWYGVATDLDIYLIDNNGHLLASSIDANTISDGWPFEALHYQNLTNAQQAVDLVIARHTGVATPRLKFILIDASYPIEVEYTAANSTDTFGSTVFGHSGARAALSIGAVPFNDSSIPEDFSSRGYPTVYFRPSAVYVWGLPDIFYTPGFSLPAPETPRKPDVAATDGGRTTFFGREEPPDVYRFYGTSAAAPHVAAVAALMKQRANQRGMRLYQASVESILESTAAPIENGSQEANGAGLIDALRALYRVDTLQFFDTYLPLVSIPSTPDLIARISLTPDKQAFAAGEPVEITVQIANLGEVAAPPFWVDLFINPEIVPETSNIIWNNVCALTPCSGIVWGVKDGLAAGQSITLTSNIGSYAADYSIWPGYFVSGTTDLYLYVDSWNPNVASGAVVESNETNNRADIHGLRVTGTNPTPAALQEATNVPMRPSQPEP